MYFILTLYNLNYIGTQDEVDDGTQDGTQGGTHRTEKGNLDDQIIEMIRKNAHVTQEEMAEKTGVSLRTIKRHTVALKKIKYVGSGESGHWEVIAEEHEFTRVLFLCIRGD